MARDNFISVNVTDTASPRLRRYILQEKKIRDKALQDTVWLYYKKLKTMIRNGAYPNAEKQELRKSETVERMNKALKSHPNGASLRKKHMHRSRKAFSGAGPKTSLWNTMRYTRVRGLSGQDLGYIYGFTSDGRVRGTTASRATRGAEKWAAILASGQWVDPKTGRPNSSVTNSMRDYFESIGIGLKKQTKRLDYKPREPVEIFFGRNSVRMMRSFEGFFIKRFNKEFNRRLSRSGAVRPAA